MYKLIKRAVEQIRSIIYPSVPISSNSGWWGNFGRTSSGVHVNSETVLGNVPVWRAINLISGTIATLPLGVFKKDNKGGREPDYDHSAWWLLEKQPSPFITTYTWKQTMIGNALLHGNSYSYIYRKPNGDPDELEILPPECVEMVWTGDALEYLVSLGSEKRRLLAENVIHFRGLGCNGYWGHPVLRVLRDALGLGLAYQKHASTYFSQGCSPGPIVITMDGTLPNDPEALEEFRKNFDNMHQGLDRSNRPMILEMGMKPIFPQINHQASQFLESREFDSKMVALLFGCPPHKLGCAINTNYNSLEQENTAWLQEGLQPHLCMAEQELEIKLLTKNQRYTDKRFIEFNRLALQSTDLLSQTEALTNQINNRIRTQNEARALLNLPDAGKDGDRFVMPANMVFVDEAGQQPEPVAPVPGDPITKEDPNPPDPTQVAPPPIADKLRSLTHATVRRYITRLEKASINKRGVDWLNEQEQAVIEGLTPVCAEDRVKELIDELRSELEAVLPEQMETVIKSIDVSKWTERILA